MNIVSRNTRYIPHPRLTIRRMVEEDLGYCCLELFLAYFPATRLVAARLGVTTRAVKYQRAATRESCITCLQRASCMAIRLAK